MNITILQGAFLPVPALRGGAVEKMWQALGAEFARRGHRVTHLSRRCDGLPAEETADGVRHVRLRGYDQPPGGLRLKACDFLYSWRARRAAPAADLVVTNTFWSPLLLRPRHGAVYVDVQRMPKGQMRLYRGAARLRANSSAVRDAILREAPDAAPRVRVIPNPLPFAPEYPVRWDAKERVVLFAGRLHPEKGIELLLAAWNRLRAADRLAGWKLRFIGPADTARGGGGETWVAGLQRRHPSLEIEWMPPAFEPAKLHAAYENATVFAYPSLAEKGETFGVAALEAMAFGAVPVVSDLACFRDFIADGCNGAVFDHRSPEPAAALAGAIERAAAPGARAWAGAAVEVRRTHAVAAIADAFLADFAALTGKR